MSDEFFKSRTGHKFYEHDVPRIADALEKIAHRLKALPLEEEKPFVEMVWIVTDVERRRMKSAPASLAFATEEKAVDYVRTQISITHQSTTGWSSDPPHRPAVGVAAGRDQAGARRRRALSHPLPRRAALAQRNRDGESTAQLGTRR